MASCCWKLLGIFLSFTQKKKGQCAPAKVRVRVELVVCSVRNSAGVKKPALAWNCCLHGFTLSSELFVIHNAPPPHALRKEGLLPSPPSRSTRVTSGQHISLRCGRLGVQWREVGEICQQLLHQEFYSFPIPRPSIFGVAELSGFI